jgi:hypothetical protein
LEWHQSQNKFKGAEMSTTLRVTAIGVGFLFTFVFGYWVSNLGKPYNGILFNIHKLIALAVVVLFFINLFRMNRVAKLGPTGTIGGVVTGLFFVALFATGALLSIDKPMPTIVLRLHEVAPYLSVLSTAVTLYLLLSHS